MIRSITTPKSSGDAGQLSWPAELIALGFHLVMIWSVIAAMQRVDSSDRFSVLGPLATAGLLLGFILARTRVQDLFAHSIAVWLGAAASFLVVGLQVGDTSEIISNRGAAFRDLISGVASSLARVDNKPQNDEQLLVVLGVTSWLLAYSSAWVVYRRRWFTAGIGVPAAILLASLQVDDRNGGRELALFMVGAIGLAARDSISAFFQRWQRRGLVAPGSSATWFMASAIPIALLTVLATMAIHPAIEQVNNVSYRNQLENTWSNFRDNLPLPWDEEEGASNGYSTFEDEWVMGGDLSLSEAIVAEVDASTAWYLAARAYDQYTGNGWRSDVGSTFNTDGEDDVVTLVTFTADNPVPVSGEISQAREMETANITLVGPVGDLALTIEQFASSDVEVQTQMGWFRFDGLTFDVENGDIESLPVDLQSMISAIRGKPYVLNAETGTVSFSDAIVMAAYQNQLAHLGQLPVSVRFAESDSGELIATFTGRAPNYDDVEVVFFEGATEDVSDYSVTGAQSAASADDLRAASTAYPEWVADRYLDLPDSVSQQTKDLARDIADSANPYDAAVAIEQHLHTYEYEENPPAAPSGTDAVDFFLFDYEKGRCQQYASAMAVMLRSLGIPTRVVAGFNSDARINESGQWAYRGNQAHLWVEVFFPGYGWIPFEPTPGFAGFDTEATENTEPADVPTPIADESPFAESTPEVQPTPTAEASPVPPTLATSNSDDGNFGRLILVLFGIGVTMLLGILGYLVVSWNRGLGGLRPASGYFARLIKLGAWFGLEPAQSTTPSEFGHSFARTVPGTESAVRSITEAYYIEQFNPQAIDPNAIHRAESGWKQLRRNLLRWRIRPPK